VLAFGQKGDVLLGISTSGQSPNLLRALEAARARGLRTLALLGGEGGAARELADLAIVVPSSDTQRIQEVHIAVLHLLCELVEKQVLQSQVNLVRAVTLTEQSGASATRADGESGQQTPHAA
jgi:DNA-binding MurR/RpiR family transcriptional regulator